MQSRNLLLLTVLILISSVFLSSCMIPSSLQNVYHFEKSKISLKVVVNESTNKEELVIFENNGKKCNESNKKGCIRAPKYSIGLIDFHLIASNDWHLTKMNICLGKEKPTVADPCSLAKADIGQFSAGASRATPRAGPDYNGVINLTDLSSDLSKFNLLDLNTFPEDYFYMITACKDGQPETCVTLDPPIENEGGGRII